ncbi:hypothetical protein HPO96_10650 [Kribbella sandramycini]|uniref:Uncharacterized protein n=1 Tax=Kribbella sandramycini TaxID=60450 RepID=A0A7Y4KXZ4_9ACTN|nr:hypothetical protein [Kribbella sandramycini]MBB6569461.1 hypothetical protein [Kribbella sandramycini]NOL40705.1 hypothetical protein [Kribbella sandramycini]
MNWLWADDDLVPEVGAEWIYRARTFASSERVRITAVQASKRSYRAEVAFCDGEAAGSTENVPANRLHGPWNRIERYDELMAGWERLDEFELTDAEESATVTAYELLIDRAIAHRLWAPLRYVTSVDNPEALEGLTGLPLAELTSRVASFELDGKTLLSREGTLLIAEYACRKNPMPVLDSVIEEEKELREKSKHGSKAGEYETDPEWEYEWYRKHHRPVHELLRQWCGHRAVTLQERLTAAEAESLRVEALANRLIDALADEGNLELAHTFARELEDDRITPESVRPVVDRPLHPSEIPVRYVTKPRRWGWS